MPTSTQEPIETPVPTIIPTPCAPDHRQSLDIQITLDHSGSMEHFLSSVKQAASLFASLTDPATDQLGVTVFDKQATTTQQLTYDRSAVLKAINDIERVDGTNIAAGIEAAHAELMSRRRNPEAVPVLLLMTDGRAPAQPAITAAIAAKADGIRIVVIAMGSNIEVGTLHAIASPNDMYQAKMPMDVAPVFVAIADSIKHGCDVVPTNRP
jgi:Mg-chelatase subunit ChlD